VSYRLTLEDHARAVSLGYAGWHKLYAAPPGSGPDGERCGTCRWSQVMFEFGGHCAQVRWSQRRIDASAPACARWEPQRQGEQEAIARRLPSPDGRSKGAP
jgi:hypothetical protein